MIIEMAEVKEMNGEQIKELINRRRRQLTVHSFLYYRLDTSIIDDFTFDRWSKELVQLQEAYPELAEQVPYHYEFKEFDGSTGMDLPFGNPEFQVTAYRLIDIQKTHRY